MPAGLKCSPWLPCRKRQGCFCEHVLMDEKLQRAPAKHEAYQCSNVDLPPKASSQSRDRGVGTPAGCFPSAIRKTLVQRSAGVLIPARQPKNSDFAHNCFYMSWVGRGQPEPSRPDASPSDWEARRRDRIGGAPSKSKICEV